MLGPLPGTQTSVPPIRLYVLQHGIELARMETVTPVNHVLYMAGQDPVYFFGTYNSPTSFAIYWVSPKSGAQFYWVDTNGSGVQSNGVGPWHDETTGLYYAITAFGGYIPSPIIEYYSDVNSGLAAIAAFIGAQGDPYHDIGNTQPGGGPFSPTPPAPYNPAASDDIGYSLLPEVSAVGTGFVSLWCPTEQQMLDLSEYMWNADIKTLDFWKKLIADPLQLIYGLNIIPLDLDALGLVGPNSESVVVGTINTGINMNYLTSQWAELDCGSITIDESMLGSYMDYDPYTKMEIYLPYIGYRPLKVDDFMPGTISVKYKVDLLTGACVAQIKSTKSNIHGDELDSVIYQFMGNCATQVPVTASQYADAVRSAITTAVALGSMAVLAGSGAAVAGAAGAELMPAAETAGLLTGPGMVPVGSEIQQEMFKYSVMTTPGPVAQQASKGMSALKQIGMMHSGASAASNVMNMKPSVERSGAIGGAAGMLASQTPYLVFTRPRIAHPENQNKYTGYPSFMTRTLNELTGFTQIQSIHLEGIPCTASELAEIDALLKGGVIF